MKDRNAADGVCKLFMYRRDCHEAILRSIASVIIMHSITCAVVHLIGSR
jgi:hypothetical protein